jgi:hypothetical protein
VSEPFQDVASACDPASLKAYLLSGGRPPRPPLCPPLLYENVLMKCWCEDPEKRPQFYDVAGEVPSLAACEASLASVKKSDPGSQDLGYFT